MSFEAFAQVIASPALQHVTEHWNAVRGSRAMPRWGDIRPSRITAALPIIWSYTYDRAADAFMGRLAGDQIQKVFHQPFRGSPMQELYPDGEFPIMFARFKRVVCGPALYRSEGMVFKFLDRYGHGERIILPLADDGVLGDGILGATTYDSVDWVPAPDLPDGERWFAL